MNVRITEWIKAFKRFELDTKKYEDAVSDAMIVFLKWLIGNSRVETYEANFIVNWQSFASTCCKNNQWRKPI